MCTCFKICRYLFIYLYFLAFVTAKVIWPINIPSGEKHVKCVIIINYYNNLPIHPCIIIVIEIEINLWTLWIMTIVLSGMWMFIWVPLNQTNQIRMLYEVRMKIEKLFVPQLVWKEILLSLPKYNMTIIVSI